MVLLAVIRLAPVQSLSYIDMLRSAGLFENLQSFVEPLVCLWEEPPLRSVGRPL
jgi:hypothetical protein